MASYSSPNLILAFDTETTGFFPTQDKNADISILDANTLQNSYPFITQLCFVVLDTTTYTIVEEFNEYIKLPINAVFSEKASEITGITRETCDKHGIDIEYALMRFYRAYESASMIVAHNIQFDISMIQLELWRTRQIMASCQTFMDMSKNVDFYFMFQHTNLSGKKLYCTMDMGKPVCNLPMKNKDGTISKFKKSPKLTELYNHLFHSIPENLHDAKVDTLACLRSFVMMKFKVDYMNM